LSALATRRMVPLATTSRFAPDVRRGNLRRTVRAFAIPGDDATPARRLPAPIVLPDTGSTASPGRVPLSNEAPSISARNDSKIKEFSKRRCFRRAIRFSALDPVVPRSDPCKCAGLDIVRCTHRAPEVPGAKSSANGRPPTSSMTTVLSDLQFSALRSPVPSSGCHFLTKRWHTSTISSSPLRIFVEISAATAAG